MKHYDIRGNAYLSRIVGLITLLDPEHKYLRPVSTHTEPDDKRAMFATLHLCGGQSAVFKEIDALFSPIHPNSGGVILNLYRLPKGLSLSSWLRSFFRSIFSCLLIRALGRRCQRSNYVSAPKKSNPKRIAGILMKHKENPLK